MGLVEWLEPRVLLAAGIVKLGPQTGFYDQPYVDIELFDVRPDPQDPQKEIATSLGPHGSGFGIYPYKHLLLDTGANSALIVSDAAEELYAATDGAGNKLYVVEGEYVEQGVAGFTEFDVSGRYRLDFTGSDGITHTLPKTDTGVRILSSPDVELGMAAEMGGIPGIIGMPAMTNRITTLDMRHWAGVTDVFEVQPISVTFPETLPEPNGSFYTVAVDARVQFDARGGLPPGSPPDAPVPVWADVPFMTGTVHYQGSSASGNFLLDTGAQMTVISERLAFAAGLDEDGDGTFSKEAHGTIAIGGIGGTINAPVLWIDQVRLPTEQGHDLTWMVNHPDEIGIEVVVLDIAEGIDGVFGVDLLTGGVGIDLTTLGLVGEPYFEQIHFDFRDWDQGTGKLYFDVSPSFDQIIPDDSKVRIIPTDGSTTATEGGAGDTYQIVLTEEPTADVQITITPDDQLEAEPLTLTFTPADWSTPQTVTVRAVDDLLKEGTHQGWITHSVTSEDAAYNGISAAAVDVHITDNHPIAALTADPTAAAPEQTVAFDASGSTHGRPDRTIVSYQWDFGDGTTQTTTEPAAAHAYAQFGSYTVTLTVIDDNAPARSDTTSLTIEVNQGNRPPVADAGGPYNVQVGDDLLLDASASSDPDMIYGDSIVEYAWDLDNDGQFDDLLVDEPTATVPWSTFGGLTPPGEVSPIAVRVTDRFGKTDSATTSVTIVAPPLGAVDSLVLGDLDPTAGGLWFQFESTHEGYLTVQASVSGSAENTSLVLYDEERSEPPLAVSTLIDGVQRIDWQTEPGAAYFLFVGGTDSGVELRLVNLLHHEGTAVEVAGTTGDDVFAFDASASRRIEVGGVAYHFTDEEVASVAFEGKGGEDRITLRGSSDDDEAFLYPDFGTFEGPGFSVRVNGVAHTFVEGGGGTSDVAILYGSEGDDAFTGGPAGAVLTGSGFSLEAADFDFVHAVARHGKNTAVLHDSQGADLFVGRPIYSQISGETFFVRARGFDEVTCQGTRGTGDAAHFFDGPGNDLFTADPAQATLQGEDYAMTAATFDFVLARSHSGVDKARLDDGSGADKFVATPHYGYLSGEDYFYRAHRFEELRADGSAGGENVAWMYDARGDDVFTTSAGESQLTGGGFNNVAVNFKSVYAFATAGGTNVAYLYDSPADNVLLADARRDEVRLFGPGYYRHAGGFEYVHAVAGEGNDTAHLADSAGNDVFVGRQHDSVLSGEAFYYRVWYFDAVHASSSQGQDVAFLFDTPGDDHLEAAGDQVRLSTGTGDALDLLYELIAYETVYARGSQGKNTASIDPDAEDRVFLTGTWE